MLGLDEREQDLIHTAALLHDIGKFIFPDIDPVRRPQADRRGVGDGQAAPGAGRASSSSASRATAPSPRSSCTTTSASTAAATRRASPARQIPLGARIIAVADTYDVMTARDSYRRPVSSEAAMAELRRVSGTQLDADVVEAFERHGRSRRGVAFSHTDEADFEHELAFERRVERLRAARGAAAA